MPTELSSASFDLPKFEQTAILEPPQIPPEPEPVSSSFDPTILLNLLGGMGDQSSSIAPLLGLLSGEKPDMMSLLPMLLPLLTAKKATPQEPPPKVNKTINLENYSIS